jgi:glyoxylase-like metal-dependent hydrolase (beta-lactamase superfamily II)
MANNRRVVRGAAIAIFAAAVGALTGAAAEAPFSKVQPVGYYRMMLGDIEVTALLDGLASVAVGNLLRNTTPLELEKALLRNFLKDPVAMSVNAYLINTGTKLVLVDAGAGGKFYGRILGRLVDNLKAAGYQPEQVDEVYITHMHSDHVGGLMAGDKLAFPNAIVRADRREAGYWLGQANMDAAAQDEKNAFKQAMESVNPYIAAGKFKTFDGDTELVPGVMARASYGHTPGHTTYVVESKGEKMALWGDLMHVGAVQFAQPSVTMRYDTDPTTAIIVRKESYQDASAKGYWIAAAHLPFPGIGHVRADDDGYVFVPANYAPAR